MFEQATERCIRNRQVGRHAYLNLCWYCLLQASKRTHTSPLCVHTQHLHLALSPPSESHAGIAAHNTDLDDLPRPLDIHNSKHWTTRAVWLEQPHAHAHTSYTCSTKRHSLRPRCSGQSSKWTTRLARASRRPRRCEQRGSFLKPLQPTTHRFYGTHNLSLSCSVHLLPGCTLKYSPCPF